MGKHNGYTSKNKTDTKILFKKSNITIRTHSRTCSDASQITKSGVLHIKKNLSKCNDYYTDGNVIKRDLSVETGVCILRRYYKSKHKRDKCSKPTSLIKSKCSTVADTEFAEFKPELACGDSTNKFEIIDQANALNIDITSLMVENLKSLLNEWIRKHVLEDTQTKKKLISVLDSILQSLGSKVSEVHSSCSTYVIERNGAGCRVRDRKTATNSVTCQYCNKKQTSGITDASSSIIFKRFSRFTIPFPYKHVRIISTLSIPRNMNKKYKHKEKQTIYKIKKQKKQVPPMNPKKDRKVVINVSSCGMSAVSKKSWEHVPKRSEKKPSSKKRGIIFLPQMFYKSTTDCTSTTEIEGVKKSVARQENHLDAMPSLVKSIFADDPANVTSTDKVLNDNNRKDNYTMTESSIPRLSSEKLINCVSSLQYHQAKYECCKESTKAPNIVNQTYQSHTKIDFVNQSIEFPNITIHKQNSVAKQFTREPYSTKPKFRKKISRKRKPFQKASPRHSSKYDYESIKFKQFSYLYKKFKNTRKKDEIFNHFRNIFEYFANYDSKRDIKLEIHCNVYPFFDIDEKYSNTNLIINDTKAYTEYEVNTIPSAAHTIVHAIETIHSDLKEKNNLNAIQTEPMQKPEIIALLDGAASQAKYIFKSDNSTSTSNNSLKCFDNTDKGTTMTGLEVSKELSELKSAINDLSVTAQKMVLEHRKRQSEKNKNDVNSPSKQKATLVESEKRVVKLANLSKGIQFSNFTKPVLKAQLLSGIKLSKEPKKTEDSLNRLKKKSSSYHIIDSESILKVTDMTAFPNKSIESNKPEPEKSKSLLQITDEKNKRKLIAFINKDARKVEKNKNDQMVFTMCPTTSSCYTPRLPPCMDYPHAMTCPYKNRSNKASQLTLPVNLSNFQGCNHTYCSSVYDIAKTNPTITVKRRSSIRFWEGFLYCILLWIPLIVIIYFFSVHIHELRKGLGSNKSNTPSSTTTEKSPNASRFLLQLADFGF